MAYDKVVDSTQLDGYFGDIADAIRGKNGSSDTYTPGQMPAAITAIPTGQADERLAQILTRATMSSTLDLSDINATIIPKYMFSGWPSLREIKLPDTIADIQTSAFENCSRMTIYGNALPTGLMQAQNVELYNRIFDGCAELLLSSLPDGTKSIDDAAFRNCYKITLDDLPDGIRSIGDNAFYGCGKITPTLLPSAIQTIGMNAFFHCTKVSFSVIPPTVTSIGNYAFEGCTGIKKMDCQTTANTSHSIFKNCTAMEWLKLKNKVITYNTAVGCTALSKAWISGNATYIYSSNASNAPFYGCAALTDIYCEATEKPSGWQTYWNYTASGVQATVHWGVSESDFDAIVAGGNS